MNFFCFHIRILARSDAIQNGISVLKLHNENQKRVLTEGIQTDIQKIFEAMDPDKMKKH